jgi:hypothetical protein
LTDVRVGGDLTISNGAHAINGNTLYVAGDVTDTTSGNSPSSTKLVLNGAQVQNLDLGSNFRMDGGVEINKPDTDYTTAVKLLANTVLNGSGDWTITAGEFWLNSFDLTVPGDFEIQENGTMRVEGPETLTVSGSTTYGGTFSFSNPAVDVNVNGWSTTFNNLQVLCTKNHYFDAGVTTVVNGNLARCTSFPGQAILRSTSDGTQWLLNLAGDALLGSKVDVKDSDASPGKLVNAPGSTDRGNNLNWSFEAYAQNIGGVGIEGLMGGSGING